MSVDGEGFGLNRKIAAGRVDDVTVLRWPMGDKSPKQVEKQAAQKQTKNNAAKQQKGQSLAVKQAAHNPKQRTK